MRQETRTGNDNVDTQLPTERKKMGKQEYEMPGGRGDGGLGLKIKMVSIYK